MLHLAPTKDIKKKFDIKIQGQHGSLYSLLFLPSGKSFVWKFFPNIVDSKLPSPVRENTKNREPKSPPSMVLSCEDDSHCLYICIPENMITVKMSEMRKEFPFDNAEIKRNIEISVKY